MAVVIRCTMIFISVFFVAHFLSKQQVQCADAFLREAVPELAYVNYDEHLFHYLNVSQVGSGLAPSADECGLSCVDVLTCFSFNVAAYPDSDGQVLCELLASDKYNSSGKFQPNSLFHHYSIYTPCSKNPCGIGGRCIALYYHDDFNCSCFPGFRGNMCEVDIDECAENTDNCSANATCHNTGGSFNCTCKTGFHWDGVDCAEEKEYLCEPIGVRYTNKIADSSMKASSYHSYNYVPRFGRLHETRGRGCWATKTTYNRNDYLQIDLGIKHAVCAVATQGCRQANLWTTQYKLSMSLDKVNWSFYQENNANKTFAGNVNENTVVKHQLKSAVDARFVRFYPTKYNGHPVLRVEIFVRK